MYVKSVPLIVILWVATISRVYFGYTIDNNV